MRAEPSAETRRCSQCTLHHTHGAEYVGGWWCADCLRHVVERGHPWPVPNPLPVARAEPPAYAARHRHGVLRTEVGR